MTGSIEDLLQTAAEKKRLEEELRIARQIQMSLLPRGPLDVPGLAITALCVPAREVGGDYYDFFQLPDERARRADRRRLRQGHVGRALHGGAEGPGAVAQPDLSVPDELLTEVNRIISDNLDSRSFITMTYAVIDLEAGTMTYARAGHTPLIFMRGLGAGEAVARAGAERHRASACTSPARTRSSIELLEEESLDLDTGDVIVLYTDGISEAMNSDGDLFGDARLSRIIEEHGHLESGELRERILREIESFVGAADQHDDMTMILMKVEQPVAERPGPEDPGRGAAGRAWSCSGFRESMTDLVTVFRTQSPMEAEVVRGLLEAHGIDTLVQSNMPRTPFPMALQRAARVGGGRRRRTGGAASSRAIARSATGARIVPFGAEFEPLERTIGYRFRDRGLLEHALTHRSRVHEDASGGVFDNESLEFLGDSVLGFVIADMLFREFPQHNEGEKSKLKASIVSATSLARLGDRIELGSFLILGRGEEKTGGRRKLALIADSYEALIAAIYLDGGIDPARAFIERQFADLIV